MVFILFTKLNLIWISLFIDKQTTKQWILSNLNNMLSDHIFDKNKTLPISINDDEDKLI